MDEHTIRYMHDVILPAMTQGFVISTSEGDISINSVFAEIHDGIREGVRDYVVYQAWLYRQQHGFSDGVEWLKRRPVQEAA